MRKKDSCGLKSENKIKRFGCYWPADEEDFKWEPPTEAEMKVIQARRERQDKISKLMGDYLLKGYKMLGEACEVCGVSEAGRCAVFVRLGELASWYVIMIFY